jgi:hypothetical protein
LRIVRAYQRTVVAHCGRGPRQCADRSKSAPCLSPAGACVRIGTGGPRRLDLYPDPGAALNALAACLCGQEPFMRGSLAPASCHKAALHVFRSPARIPNLESPLGGLCAAAAKRKTLIVRRHDQKLPADRRPTGPPSPVGSISVAVLTLPPGEDAPSLSRWRRAPLRFTVQPLRLEKRFNQTLMLLRVWRRPQASRQFGEGCGNIAQ